MEQVQGLLQKLIEQAESNNKLLMTIKKDLHQILQEWEDEGDEDDDIREDFDNCDDVSDITTFMSEWMEKSEIKAAIRFLNKNYDYALELTGSEDKLIEQLDDEDQIDFEHLKDAIEETIDLDE